MKIDISEVGKQCGLLGGIAECYSATSFDESAEYVTRVASGGTKEGSAETVEVPVRSIGKAGARWYFAPDLRFVIYPGFERVMPEDVAVEFNCEDLSKSGGGRVGWVARLSYLELAIFRGSVQKNMEDAVADAREWASRNSTFHYPEGLIQ